MLGNKDRLALRLQQAQNALQLTNRRKVEVRRRLVQKEHLRVRGIDARNGKTLLLTARELKDAAVHKAFYSQLFCRVADSSSNLCALQSLILATEGHLARGIKGIELRARVLENGSHAAGDLVLRA